MENRGKFPLSENRTPDRIPPASGLGVASQNALVGDPGLQFPALFAGLLPVSGPLQTARDVVPTRRLAPVDNESSLVSPPLGAQSALAKASPPLFWLPSLSSALSHDLATLLFTVVDHPLASMRTFVLKLCSES